MGEAPDLREQEDCPSREACDQSCDQHEKDQRRVPDCPACGRLLGLYYAECQTCFAWAHVYTLADYEAMSIPPGGESRD